MRIITEEICKQLITPKDAIQLAQETILNLDKTSQFKYYVKLEHGDLRIMPANVPSPVVTNVTGVKLVSVIPKRDKTVESVTLLFDIVPEFVVVESSYLTALRTGAIGALATKLLCNKNPITIGIVGAGVQAYYQVLCHKEIKNIDKVYVYDINHCKSEKFKNSFSDVNIRPRAFVRDVCNVDVLITTTTSTYPVVFDEDIKDGIHINAIGADAKGKQEIEPKLLCRENCIIVCDSVEQCKEYGELNVPLHSGDEVLKFAIESNIFGDLHKVVKKGIELYGNEVTVFDSTGISALDVRFAEYVFNHYIWNSR